MEIKLHVKHDFSRMKPADKCTFGSNVIKQLTEHSNSFGTLPVSIAELKAANNTLEDTLRLYRKQAKMAKSAFLAARKEWLRRIRITASHIDTLADGDGVMIRKAGFHPTKSESAPSKKLQSVNIKTIYGTSQKGAVRAKVRPLRDARGYVLGMATSDVKIQFAGDQIIFRVGDSMIALAVGTKRDVTFTGLPRLTSVQAMAAAFNRAGLGHMSTQTDVSVP